MDNLNINKSSTIEAYDHLDVLGFPFVRFESLFLRQSWFNFSSISVRTLAGELAHSATSHVSWKQLSPVVIPSEILSTFFTNKHIFSRQTCILSQYIATSVLKSYLLCAYDANNLCELP